MYYKESPHFVIFGSEGKSWNARIMNSRDTLCSKTSIWFQRMSKVHFLSEFAWQFLPFLRKIQGICIKFSLTIKIPYCFQFDLYPLRDHPSMMSDDFWRFLTPHPPLKSDIINGRSLTIYNVKSWQKLIWHNHSNFLSSKI